MQRRLYQTILTAALVVTLAGCADVRSKSPRHISINHDGVIGVSESYKMAERHCAKFGKFAVPTHTIREFPGRTINFRCD